MHLRKCFELNEGNAQKILGMKSVRRRPSSIYAMRPMCMHACPACLSLTRGAFVTHTSASSLSLRDDTKKRLHYWFLEDELTS